MHRFIRQVLPNFKQVNFLAFSNPIINKVKLHQQPLVKNKSIKLFLTLSVLQWLGFEKDDEEKESELIMTLKRAVLCTQREQYDKAEQMLHIALRLAQQQQNKQGILYCFDLMGNLAFDTFQLEKAQKIFVIVMQMLLESGVKEDDNKMVHVSLKVARINHLLAREDVAETGFKWCLEKITPNKNQDYDTKLLYGVVQDWYAQFLLDRGEVTASLEHLKEAYDVCCEVEGKNTEQTMLLLNDLGITSWKAGDIQKAEAFLNDALILGKKLDDQRHLGVVQSNLGLIYLQNGFVEKAHEFCKMGWKLGKHYDDNESIGQSTYCLDQIREVLGEKQQNKQK